MADHNYGKCEDPLCDNNTATRTVFMHSTELYYPQRFKETGEKLYWACDTCVTRDHELFDSDRVKDKFK